MVHGQGLDELTTTGESTVLALDDDTVRTFVVDPVDLGLAPAIMDELVGGTPAVNAAVVRSVLAGDHGAARNIVLLNAAAGLVVAGVVHTLGDGLQMAVEAIDSGAAASTLERWVAASQRAAEELGR